MQYDAPARARLDRHGVAVVELGSTMFFDPRLSRGDRISCATCHKPELGFGDGLVLSKGVHGNVLQRHTPHLVNLGAATSFFWDGRASSLEEQALMPIENPDEMDMPIDLLVVKLAAVPEYAAAFQRLYPERGLCGETIASALAAFQRTLVSQNSSFDRYMHGDRSALDAGALRGLGLFEGRAGCTRCHQGHDLTDRDFHNTGVVTDDLGRQALDRAGLTREFQIRPYPFFATHKAFKTPSLRNVSLTAPYFHDGSKATLQDVVRFYDKGGDSPDSRGRSLEVRPLNLTDEEVADLVSFLEALTDPSFVGLTQANLAVRYWSTKASAN